MSLLKKKHDHIHDAYLKSLLLAVDDFLDTHYTFRCEKRYHGLLGRLRAFGDMQSAEEQEARTSQERYLGELLVQYSAPSAAEIFKKFEQEQESFGEKLVRQIEAKGLDPVAVYKKANIDRKLFSKIKTQKDYIPGLENDFYYHYQWKHKLNCEPAYYIIVDEIQDFTRDEIEEFIEATRKSFYFFGDTAQSIYEGMKNTLRVDGIKFEFPQLRLKVKDFTLYRNYRLPIPVAKLTNQVGIDLDPFEESTYRSSENAIPRIIHYNTRNDQIEAIHRMISNRNMTDVAILLPNNNLVREVYDQLLALGGDYEVNYKDKENWYNNVENLNFNSTNPKVMTYHSAKGLQFETVFLPYIEYFNDKDRKALYVAMTRTYRNLYVMYSYVLPAVFSDVEKSLYLTTETDNVEDI